MCFDFDGRPCIQVRTFEGPLSYLSDGIIAMHRLCDLREFPNLRGNIANATITSRTYRYWLTTLTGHTTGLPAYLLRGEPPSVAFCKIPGTYVWLQLIHPNNNTSDYFSKLRLWTIRVGETRNGVVPPEISGY